LAGELAAVGIRGRARDRILTEAADHLAEGQEEHFGDPRELAQLFADERATQATTRAAFTSFGALGLAGAGFAAGWSLLVVGAKADITSASFLPLGLVAAFALVACPPNTALAFGAASMVAFAGYAVEYDAAFARWQVLAAVTGALALTLPLAGAAVVVCFELAGALALLLLAAGGLGEGSRNAVAEIVLVVGSFAALGRRLGIRS
jgi:hypothetical protein